MNVCQFIGEVTRKDFRTLPSGSKIMRLGLKVGKDKGFTFVDVDLWDELAISNQNILEGQQVMAICNYEKRTYERDGKRVPAHYFKTNYLFKISH